MLYSVRLHCFLMESVLMYMHVGASTILEKCLGLGLGLGIRFELGFNAELTCTCTCMVDMFLHSFPRCY